MKFSFTLFLLFSLTAFSQKSFDELLKNGAQFYQDGNIPDAIKVFSEAINKEPKNINGYYFRGQMFLFSDQYDSAIKDFKQTIALKDSFYKAYQFLGICYLKKQDTTLALKSFDKALSINPDYFDALQNKATIALSRHDYNTALYYIDKTLVLQANDAKANFQKGFCLIKMKYKKEATPFLEESLKNGFDDPVLYDLLSICYLDKKETSKALLMSNKAINMNSNIGNFHINNALILYEMKLNLMAKEKFEKAISLGTILSKEQEEIYEKL